MRHNFATLKFGNKAYSRHIQEMLGNAWLNPTKAYALVSIAELKEVRAKCHPREKDKE